MDELVRLLAAIKEAMSGMNREQLTALLVSRAHKAGSQARLALELGVSPSYLNDVMQGRKEPGKGILEPLGLERVVSYRRK